MKAMIDLRLEKAFYINTDAVITNFTLKVGYGDRLCLKGASGVGKTTVIKIIAGLHKDYTGRLHIDPAARIAYVPQSAGLLPWKRVLKNVTLLKKGRKVDNSPLMLLEKLGLKDLHRRFPNQLSGGQYQRVALAAALTSQPTILLLDESFSALDGDAKINSLKILDEYLRQSGATLILVSHTDVESKYLNCKVIEVKK